MDKAQLIKEIADGLRRSLGILDKAARAAHAEATHESSRAENKYDTRGLEASYLAAGQARQARETLAAIKLYDALAPKAFAKGEPVDLGALVQLTVDRTRSFYFVGPSGGGLEVTLDGEEITVITPSSPLGQSVMGKQAGDKWTTNIGGAKVRYEIMSVK